MDTNKRETQEMRFRGPGGVVCTAREIQAMMTETWTNNACLGYAISAMERLGYKRNIIQQVIDAMKAEFEIKSVKQADNHYCNSPY